jgi:hypothetical protein
VTRVVTLPKARFYFCRLLIGIETFRNRSADLFGEALKMDNAFLCRVAVPHGNLVLLHFAQQMRKFFKVFAYGQNIIGEHFDRGLLDWLSVFENWHFNPLEAAARVERESREPYDRFV